MSEMNSSEVDRPRMRLLVVDDRSNMLSLMAKVMADLAEVHVAEKGSDAVQMLKNHPIDVVLCDLKMPDLDGLEVLKACKQTRPQSEFVLMTAYATVDTAVEALKKGAFDYITKPFEPEVAREVLIRAFEQSQQTVKEEEGTWAQAVERGRADAGRRYLEALMRRFEGRVMDAATHAGVERESFYRLLRRHDIEPSRFRKKTDREIE